MNFLYSVLLKLLYPTCLSLIFLGLTVVLRKRRGAMRICFCIAVAIILFCGNIWVVQGLTKHLEWQYLPPNPMPQADTIIVLSGGILAATPPRTTVEVGDAGDRLLYGAHLLRQGKAPYIICTGNVATGGVAFRPAAEEMFEFLKLLGIPADSIITELKSENTREHAVQLFPLLKDRGFKRVLLVTSAMHMPRSVGVFRKLCPGIEFIPAPTDFRVAEIAPSPWYRKVVYFIPTPHNLCGFSEAMHEYLGMAYCKLRGWM